MERRAWTDAEEEDDDTASVVSLIDEEPWAEDVEFEDHGLDLPDFHEKLTRGMSPQEARETNDLRVEMARLMRDLVFKSASLMKGQFTFHVGVGPPAPLKKEYYWDFLEAYRGNCKKPGRRTRERIGEICKSWLEMLKLNQELPRRGHSFWFEPTPEGQEAYVKDWKLFRIANRKY